MQFLTSILLLAVLALTVAAAPAVDTLDIEAFDAIDYSLPRSADRDIAFDDTDAEAYARLKAGANSTLQARDYNYELECSKYGFVHSYRVVEGMRYLDRLTGTPKLGPSRCTRVSCSWKTAIHWCNDDPYHSMELQWFARLARSAEIIVDHCANSVGMVSGTLYNADGWRVVVKQTGDVKGDPNC